jgi:hypothetical protein
MGEPLWIKPKDKKPSPISTAAKISSQATHSTLLLWNIHHLQCVYTGWLHDFNCTTKTEKWSCVLMWSFTENFDPAEVERQLFNSVITWLNLLHKHLHSQLFHMWCGSYPATCCSFCGQVTDFDVATCSVGYSSNEPVYLSSHICLFKKGVFRLLWFCDVCEW